MDLTNFRVYAVAGDDTACGQYRILKPLRYLERQGLKFNWSTGISPSEVEAFNPNVVLFQRQFSPDSLNLLHKLLAKNTLCIYELDDNLHRILPNSPALAVYKQGSIAWKNTQTFIYECHGCTYSTQELSTFYGKLNPNRRVVENCIDFDLRDWNTPYTKPPIYTSGKRIVLGWSGGAQHQDDIPILNNVIPEIMSKYQNVDVALYTNSLEAQRYFDLWKVPNERRIIIQPQSFNSYPHHLGLFDIGLCPLMRSEFNMCKSALKVLEYSARGVVSVASDEAPYAREIVQGQTGMLASNDGEFVEALSSLIENPSLLNTIRQNAYDHVHEDHDLGKNCINWPIAWQELAEGYNSGAKEGASKELQTTKPSRNDACPCGSGKKYKKCCYPAFG